MSEVPAPQDIQPLEDFIAANLHLFRGSNPKWIKDHYRRNRERLGLADCIFVRGRVTFINVPAFMRRFTNAA